MVYDCGASRRHCSYTFTYVRTLFHFSAKVGSILATIICGLLYSRINSGSRAPQKKNMVKRIILFIVRYLTITAAACCCCCCLLLQLLFPFLCFILLPFLCGCGCSWQYQKDLRAEDGEGKEKGEFKTLYTRSQTTTPNYMHP